MFQRELTNRFRHSDTDSLSVERAIRKKLIAFEVDLIDFLKVLKVTLASNQLTLTHSGEFFPWWFCDLYHAIRTKPFIEPLYWAVSSSHTRESYYRGSVTEPLIDRSSRRSLIMHRWYGECQGRWPVMIRVVDAVMQRIPNQTAERWSRSSSVLSKIGSRI